MTIIGIDPGPEQSAYCLIGNDYRPHRAAKVDNSELLEIVAALEESTYLAIESIQSYGAPVGRETFETCYQIGRIQQAATSTGKSFTLYPRPEYSKAICGCQRVNDAVLRQALLLRFGGDRKGEPLHVLKGCSDKRSAFAVAVYHLDKTT